MAPKSNPRNSIVECSKSISFIRGHTLVNAFCPGLDILLDILLHPGLDMALMGLPSLTTLNLTKPCGGGPMKPDNFQPGTCPKVLEASSFKV